MRIPALKTDFILVDSFLPRGYMDERNIKLWKTYKKEFRLIYIVTVSAFIAGLTIDLLKTDIYLNPIALDVFTIFVWIAVLVLLFSKKVKPTICFGIAAYALIVNILGTFALYHKELNIMITFLRDTVFIAFILTLSAYFINKYHAIIISGIYILFLLLFNYFSETNLLENSVTIMFSIVAYSFIIYYFVRLQEKTLKELNSLNQQKDYQNDALLQQQEEITSQRDILERQKKIIERRNQDILEGIKFAKSIQDSVLTKEADIARYFKQYFVISRPKDVISGDFFWLKEWNGSIYLAIADCTGHGVPGGLVSMLGNMYLGRAFIELENPDPGKILNYINNAISREIRMVDNFHARVGMDIACLRIDLKRMTMDYAGAFNPLYMIRRDNLIQFEATRLMMGSTVSENEPLYQNQTIELKKGDRFYLFTDGIADQFGGPLDKKFGYKRFRNTLLDTNHENMEIQKSLFWKKWMEWKADKTQVDDMLLVGFEI